jgi:hypothetical protein
MIVLDASSKMNAPFGDGKQTKWEVASAAAKRLIAFSNPNAQYGLIAIGGTGENDNTNPCGEPATPLIPFTASDGSLLPDNNFPMQNVLAKINELNPSGGGAFDQAFYLAKTQLENLPTTTLKTMFYITGASDTCDTADEWEGLKELIAISKGLDVRREIILLSKELTQAIKDVANEIKSSNPNTNMQVAQSPQEVEQSVDAALVEVAENINEKAPALYTPVPTSLYPTRTPTKMPTFAATQAPPPTDNTVQWLMKSPDGRYGVLSAGQNYQVFATQDPNTPIVTTSAKYPTPNDVKAGQFSGDSSKFAAAYHYGDNGDYTWIGVWSTTTGQFLYSVEVSGFITDLSAAFN